MEGRQYRLQSGQGQLARLLDALYFYSARAGDTMTFAMISDFCRQYGVRMSRRKTIEPLLHTTLGGQPVFAQVEASAPEDGRINAPDLRLSTLPQLTRLDRSKYLKKGGTKSRGRAPSWYQLPEPMWVFPLPDAAEYTLIVFNEKDFVTGKTYREAVYKTFIWNHSHRYTRSDLGRRHGVTGRTTAQYDKDVGTQVTPEYRRRRHDIVSLRHVHFEEEGFGPGIWLEDQRHWHYRPYRYHALDIISRDGFVTLVRRVASSYSAPKGEGLNNIRKT